MEQWRFACPDWQDRIRAGRSLIPPLKLFRSEADVAVRAFDNLCLPDVPGTPLLADAGGAWFRDIVEALHGSYDPATGIRHIREVFTLVPKKNSKTTNGAALMVVSLIVNRRPRAEFLLVAPTQKVTELAFSQAAGMVLADPYLRNRFNVVTHLKKIVDLKTDAKLEIKSFDPKIVTGTRGAGILLDELHVVASVANADRVIGQLRGGLVSQPEGFLFIITTQSERPPSGVFRAELIKARSIRDGLIGGAMLPVLYEFPPGVDWRNVANWPMVTPNNGLSVNVERLVPDYEAAVAAGEQELRRWASQHLNVEIGLALANDRWAGADFWEINAAPCLTLEELLRVCEVVVIGIDGGGLDDLLGLAVLGRHAETRNWLLWCRAWAHPSVLERRKSEAGRLLDFESNGDLILVKQLGEDIAGVADIVEQVEASGLLAEKNAIGVDPFGIGQIVDELASRGVDNDDNTRIVALPQGWKLNGAIKTTERKLADGSLTHAGQPIMAWCVGNAKAEPRGNAVAITKQAAGTAKIDPLMAAFNAVALMTMNPEARGGSGRGRAFVM
jgi:phage terminase large subunit-like protein